MEKLKSRKFWITLVVLVVITFSNQLGLDLNWEQILGILGATGSYLLSQGGVDAVKQAKFRAAIAEATDAVKQAEVLESTGDQ